MSLKYNKLLLVSQVYQQFFKYLRPAKANKYKQKVAYFWYYALGGKIKGEIKK